ncbi:MAG: structural protein VP1 [Gammaproteobacteria bacterium]|nr:structural protein VP1 [Gammaproteobacteria bacterium]
MQNKLISGMITIVIGLALLPVINDFVDGLTGEGGALADTTVGSLVDLLPILYVIVLVAGVVGYISYRRS